jgi:hypothetical protein
MRLKLKSILIVSAGLSLLFTLGVAQSAYANKQHAEFACEDGTTDFATANEKDAAGHPQIAIRCKSNSKITLDPQGLQLSAVDASCPNSEDVGTSFDVPDAPTKYIFYCVLTSGNEGHTTTRRTNSTPTLSSITTAPDNQCADGTTPPGNDVKNCPVTTTTPSNGPGDPAVNGGHCSDVKNCDLIQNFINPFINLLAALVGVAVTISIVVGGIQYSNSGGDAQAVAAAKARIRNAIIALITFIFLWALLDFLIPGGLL